VEGKKKAAKRSLAAVTAPKTKPSSVPKAASAAAPASSAKSGGAKRPRGKSGDKRPVAKSAYHFFCAAKRPELTSKWCCCCMRVRLLAA
jgi:hypothetical protein